MEYREDGALPNSSSTLFFFSDEYFEDYMGAPVTLGALGLISDEPSVTRVTTETAVNVSARHALLRRPTRCQNCFVTYCRSAWDIDWARVLGQRSVRTLIQSEGTPVAAER